MAVIPAGRSGARSVERDWADDFASPSGERTTPEARDRGPDNCAADPASFPRAEEGDELAPDELAPDEPVSAAASAGIAHTAAPTPSATAKPPTRPT